PSPLEALTRMASTPDPARSSDPPPPDDASDPEAGSTIFGTGRPADALDDHEAPFPGRTGEPVTFSRRNPVSPGGGPGSIRVVCLVGDDIRELTGDEALAALPQLVPTSDNRVWVDLAGATREQVEAVGSALQLHPLIVEDVLEGNQRAKIESTDG